MKPDRFDDRDDVPEHARCRHGEHELNCKKVCLSCGHECIDHSDGAVTICAYCDCDEWVDCLYPFVKK